MTAQQKDFYFTVIDLTGHESSADKDGPQKDISSNITMSLLGIGQIFTALKNRDTPCWNGENFTRLVRPFVEKSSNLMLFTTAMDSIERLTIEYVLHPNVCSFIVISYNS